MKEGPDLYREQACRLMEGNGNEGAYKVYLEEREKNKVFLLYILSTSNMIF